MILINKSLGENNQSKILKYLHHHAICKESESSHVILSAALFGLLCEYTMLKGDH